MLHLWRVCIAVFAHAKHVYVYKNYQKYDTLFTLLCAPKTIFYYFSYLEKTKWSESIINDLNSYIYIISHAVNGIYIYSNQVLIYSHLENSSAHFF